MKTITLNSFIYEDQWNGDFTLVKCTRALNPSKLPGIDYALNPYGGCAHGCKYCYAPEVTHSEWKDWRCIKVKYNIPSRLSKEIKGLNGTIGIGTVTDPYQYAEKRFRLTSECLNVISNSELGIHIHTKSDLIVRDVDIISSMNHVIGITITTPSPSISKFTEPGAPLPDKRIEAMKTLVSNGCNVYALIGPVMSTLEGLEEDLVSMISSTGVKTAYIDRLNLRPLLEERLKRMNIGTSSSSEEKLRTLLNDVGIKTFDVF